MCDRRAHPFQAKTLIAAGAQARAAAGASFPMAVAKVQAVEPRAVQSQSGWQTYRRRSCVASTNLARAASKPPSSGGAWRGFRQIDAVAGWALRRTRHKGGSSSSSNNNSSSNISHRHRSSTPACRRRSSSNSSSRCSSCGRCGIRWVRSRQKHPPSTLTCALCHQQSDRRRVGTTACSSSGSASQQWGRSKPRVQWAGRTRKQTANRSCTPPPVSNNSHT